MRIAKLLDILNNFYSERFAKIDNFWLQRAATRLIFELASFKLLIKHNYFFSWKQERWNKIRDSIPRGRSYFGFNRLQSIRSRFSSTLPTEKSRTTYIYRHVYICTYVCVCMCVTRVLLHCFGCYRLSFLLFMRGYGYVRIIATNISHRPTFRSTTQHNHCRISLRFFFHHFFFRFLPFASHVR